MDSSKFDDIIKEKLEAHVDPSEPSGTEMSKLFDALPAPPMTSVISTTTKLLTAASTILLITTIFLIYRTYYLEHVIFDLKDNLSQRQGREYIMQDEVFWDSLEYKVKRLSIRPTYTTPAPTDSIGQAYLTQLIAKHSNSSISKQDSQRIVNQALASLVSALESNPDLINRLVSKSENLHSNSSQQNRIQQAADNQKQTDPVLLASTANDKRFQRAVQEETLSRQLNLLSSAQRNEDEAILTELLSEYSEDTRLTTDSESQIAETDQQYINRTLSGLSDEEINTLSDDLQEAFLSLVEDDEINQNETLTEEPKDENTLLAEENEKTDEDEETAGATTEAVREKQKKQREKSWQLFGGAGLGFTQTESFDIGNVTTTPFFGGIEYNLSKRLSLAISAELSSLETGVSNPEDVDLSFFPAAQSIDEDDISEVKVELKWLDIPLEARFYLLPDGKIKPYALLSVKGRLLSKQEYKVETEDNREIEEDLGGNKFSTPVLGIGAGAKISLSRNLDAALQIQQDIGGQGLGPFEDKLNALKVQGALFIKLK